MDSDLEALFASDDENIPEFFGFDVDAEPLQTAPLEVNLPAYTEVPIVPTVPYNNIDGVSFADTINHIYNTILKWKKNLFQTPSGAAGKEFIKLLTLWLNNFNNNSSFKGIALKVYMVLPSLMLQKPSPTSKAKDHTDALRSRLRMWNKGNFLELLREGTIIQQRIGHSSKRKPNPEDLARSFAKLMFVGKVNAAMKLIETNSESGVLPGTDEVINMLKEKHPEPGPIASETLINGPIQPPSAAHFFGINEASIWKAALHTRGAGGPSQFDADQHKHVLCSKKFKPWFNHNLRPKEEATCSTQSISTHGSCMGKESSSLHFSSSGTPTVQPASTIPERVRGA